MTPLLTASALTWTYPTAGTPALGPVDHTVQAGQLVLITGPTGCGKSTLLRLYAGLLPRHAQGRRAGAVAVGGQDPAAMGAAERVRTLAFVSQEPQDQLLAGSVREELAFAARRAGVEGAALEARVAAGLRRAGLEGLAERSPFALSGGQQQRLACAAALSAGAPLLLLDEPLAALDPLAARALVTQLRALADEGVTVLVVEHRLEELLPRCDRALVLAQGQVAWEGSAAALDAPTLRAAGLRPPSLWALHEALRDRGLDPARVRWTPPPVHAPPPAPPLLRLQGAYRRYGGRAALDGVDLAVGRGERLALVGPNGAGKSTLLAALGGRLDAGTRVGAARVVEVPQDPDLALFCATVAEELAYGPREQGLSPAAALDRTASLARALGLEALLDRPPQALSRGQRLRLACAAALACTPDLLLLDEPTSGQDLEQVEALLQGLRAHLGAGALVFATHDLELALRHATRVVVLDQGRVLADGPPLDALRALPDTLPRPPLLALALEHHLPLGEVAQLAAWASPGPEVAPTPPAEVLTPPPEAPPPATAPPSGLDPRTKLGLVACVGLAALAMERPLGLGLLCALCALPLLGPWAPPGWRGRATLGALALVWSTVLSQGLFYAAEPRVALVELGPLTLWREGARYGLVQSLRFVAVSLAGLGLVATTAPSRLLEGLRLPPALALMLSAALHSLPELGHSLATTRLARARRGRPAHHRPPWAWLALELSLLRPVVARLLRRARTLGESLDLRGFDPASTTPLRPPEPWPPGHRALLALGLGLSVALLALRGIYGLYASDTWYHPAFRDVVGWVRVWL